MMSKKELLEFAAKVYANPNLKYCPVWKGMAEYDCETQYYNWDSYWNALTNSDNALDLVTLLGLSVMAHEDGVTASDNSGRIIIEVAYDDEGVSSASGATRLAITKVAACVMGYRKY